MKTTTSLVATLVIVFSAITVAVAGTESNDGLVSVLAKSAVQDEAVPPVPAEAAVQEPVAAVEQITQDPVAPVAPVPAGVPVAPVAEMGSVVMGQPMVAGGCNSCCATPCNCCPPAPAKVNYCLVDPCGCSYEACVCVPGCCLGVEPCITWRNGILGRQIATMCWKCCGHEVKVIIKRNGKVKVRD